MPDLGPSSGITEKSRTVLALLREQALDGFTLRSKTGFDKSALLASLQELSGRGLIRVAGDLTEPGMDEAFYSVPLGSVGNADLELGRLSSQPSLYRR
jgi:hypothetical protein